MALVEGACRYCGGDAALCNEGKHPEYRNMMWSVTSLECGISTTEHNSPEEAIAVWRNAPSRNSLWGCVICGDTDACERCEDPAIPEEPVRCDKCFEKLKTPDTTHPNTCRGCRFEDTQITHMPCSRCYRIWSMYRDQYENGDGLT